MTASLNSIKALELIIAETAAMRISKLEEGSDAYVLSTVVLDLAELLLEKIENEQHAKPDSNT